jgi:glycosyltransferase involved in cell wall biosynthesis
MENQTNLISIIIPAYNAAAFIDETIQSIFRQTYPNWEMIIINDGSTDRTGEIISRIKDHRVRYINQSNAGVAAARNKGLAVAKGEFVVFFDADDLMSEDFLATRVNALKKDPAIGYCGGLVQTFPGKVKTRKAVASDPENEILFFNKAFVTVPSNYIFRKRILISNGIIFNKELSSSADRFFILEVSKVAKGKNISDVTGKLLYRVTSQSMSNNVTPGLIIDNEKFYYELKRKNLLPYGKKHKFKSFYFLSLAKGFGMVKYWKRVLKYLAMSFINDPVFFTKSFGKSVIAFPYIKGLKVHG